MPPTHRTLIPRLLRCKGGGQLVTCYIVGRYLGRVVNDRVVCGVQGGSLLGMVPLYNRGVQDKNLLVATFGSPIRV